jgi:GT2 family glycosyltransferase
VRTFERNPRATAVYGPCRSHDASALINGVSGFFFTQWLRISRILGLDNTCGFNFVIRRDAFDAVGGYDPLHVKMSPDVELGQRLAKVGPVVLRSDILVEASTRRFQKEGFLPTLWMFMKVWVQILRRGEPKATYAEYNKEIR